MLFSRPAYEVEAGNPLPELLARAERGLHQSPPDHPGGSRSE